MSAPNLRNTRKEWRDKGGSIEDMRRTGEERYSHPNLKHTIKVNKRRKDSPRKLLLALREISKK